MQEFNLSIPAGESNDVYANGRFIRVVASPYKLKLSVTATAENATMSQGQSVTLEQDISGHLSVTNLGGATAQVTLLIGNGKFTDNSLSGDIKSIVVQGTAVADPQVTLVANTAKQLVASDAARKSVRFYNPLTDVMWIGGESSIAVGQGIPVPAGGTWVESEGAAAAWYGISAAAGTVNVQAVS